MTWCECGRHLVDEKHILCPVCTDRARQDAEAAATILGWRVFGTGGRA